MQGTPKKQALLVAVGDYNELAPKLRAPVGEMERWADVLHAKFGFPKDGITCLQNGEATRLTVLRHLGRLLKDANDSDQLVFIFMGHAGIAHGWSGLTSRSKDAEHAVFVYPEGDSLQDAAITPSDLTRTLRESKPNRNADVTVILDCCLAEYLNFPPPDERYQAQLLRVPHAVFADDHVQVARTFDLRDDDPTIAHPIILVASGTQEGAFEITEHNERRLIFSLRAIERLRALLDEPDTYRRLIDGITPLRDRFPQTPSIIGNKSLQFEHFPGEPSKSSRLLPSAVPSSVNALQVRFIGMGTFVKAPSSSKPYKERIVLPFDNYAKDSPMTHFGFVEVAVADTVDYMGEGPAKEYVRGGVRYRRWHLTHHRVSIANAVLNGPFSHSDEFNKHVPRMPLVCPELLGVAPRPECYYDYPRPDLFSGFIDLASGSVGIADLELLPTMFTRQFGEEPTNWPPERTPLSVLLTLPFESGYAVISISEVSGKQTEIFVKSGAVVMMGNAREKDITGDGTGDNPREHFIIYYNLADPKPLNPGLPATIGVPMGACSVNGWP